MKYLRYLITVTIIAAIFGGYFYYLTMSGRIEQNPISSTLVAAVRPYPALTNPRELTLNCDYHGKNMAVTETLYGSLYDYYRTDPTKKSAYLHNQEKDFVTSYEQDGTVHELSTKIQALGTANGLAGDQILDLSACLIQNIPYDDAKAARILGPNFATQPIDSVIPRYPYETLYDKTGICTDKTYLGAAVLRELGYETAILTFDAQKHMSLGVAVPAGYGSFGTKYGIMELTGSGFLVGDVPDLNATAGLAINNYQTLPQGDASTGATGQLKLATPSNVIAVSAGSAYSRVVERAALKKTIDEQKVTLETAQTNYKQAATTLAAAETNLATAESAYKSHSTNASYADYTRAYNQYIVAYNDAQSKINQYNKAVNLYNSYIEKYRRF